MKSAGRRLEFSSHTRPYNIEDLSQEFIDAIGTNKDLGEDFRESVKRLSTLLKLRKSSSLDSEQIERVEDLLKICVEALLYKYPTATLPQLFLLFLEVRSAHAGRIVMRKMNSMARAKIVDATTHDETRKFFEDIPRFDEVPEFRLLFFGFFVRSSLTGGSDYNVAFAMGGGGHLFHWQTDPVVFQRKNCTVSQNTKDRVYRR